MPELKWLQGFKKEGASSKVLPLGILRNLTLKVLKFLVKTLKFVSPHKFTCYRMNDVMHLNAKCWMYYHLGIVANFACFFTFAIHLIFFEN